MIKELRLIITAQRTNFPALQTPQEAYVLLEVLPSVPAPEQGSPPVNLGSVVDRSGSMAGAKLKAMKAAAKQVLDSLGPPDRLAGVVFDDANLADLIIPSGPVSDQEAAKRKIEAIEERGGTSRSIGMCLGLEELRRRDHPQRVSALLLLTDGQTWEDVDGCRVLAGQCQAAGIPTHVLGLGGGEQSNWDPKLLEDLAQLSGGEWMLVEASEQVSKAFEKTLFAMEAAVATHAKLIMRFVQEETVRTVWRVNPLICRLEAHSGPAYELQVFLRDVQHGTGQAIPVDLILPPRAAGAYRLMLADIAYDVPGGLAENALCYQTIDRNRSMQGQAIGQPVSEMRKE